MKTRFIILQIMEDKVIYITFRLFQDPNTTLVFGSILP
jgi:hypothetical protein